MKAQSYWYRYLLAVGLMGAIANLCLGQGIDADVEPGASSPKEIQIPTVQLNPTTPSSPTPVSSPVTIARRISNEPADVAAMNQHDNSAGTGADRAVPTAHGNKGGATPQTENLPLDKASLLQIRKQQLGKPEFRGAWVTRFDWVSPNAEQMRSKIVQIMDLAKAAGLNAVVFQVRADASTFYPSELEPWSHLIGGRDPGFDPVQFAIDEAHKRGLEFHAYINAMPCSEKKEGPSDPRHIWFRHCTAQSNPNWLVYEGGKPAEFKEYWWLNPNLPEVQTYVRMVVLDFATRYNVDGIHYDRIRFPGPKVSDDPWSLARFRNGANPKSLNYNEWQCENITKMLCDIYGAVIAVKPNIKFTAAVWGIHDKTRMPQGNDRAIGYSWTSSGLQDYHQDSIGWTKRGCIDALIPMIYWEMGDKKPDYDELLAYFVQNAANDRHIYGGQKVFNDVEMLRQAVATQLVGGKGTCPFTLMRVHEKGLIGFYRSAIFPDDVPTPPMPWKTQPSKAVVLVTVKDQKGMPVLDAYVKTPGRSDVWLSSADGFCAILDAEPGSNVTVTAEKDGVGRGVSESFNAIPGKPARVTVVLK
ncbi:hypothetical protein BRCON_2448 [Candidatus Sumerlaea chitinivorans]|uniref:Glycosyl hydrolase-like 10 domain-containing protein n=1 Tax=Sumerlaea chitinivorans TaxID=2250252 RepID=A0A2Z4Y8S3_SUMC1|nr:hypothetical protein BRCON_2448 [Candidatus Sumerlaea chitinivorans]